MQFKASLDFRLEDDFVLTAFAEVDKVAVADKAEVVGDFGGVGGVEVEAVVLVVAEAGLTTIDDVVPFAHGDDVRKPSRLHDVVAAGGTEVEADADGPAEDGAASTQTDEVVAVAAAESDGFVTADEVALGVGGGAETVEEDAIVAREGRETGAGIGEVDVDAVGDAADDDSTAAEDVGEADAVFLLRYSR